MPLSHRSWLQTKVWWKHYPVRASADKSFNTPADEFGFGLYGGMNTADQVALSPSG